MTDLPDVDIEVRDRERVVQLFDHIPASLESHRRLVKHISGIYLQNIPIHPLSGVAAFHYEDAEELGFYKIDLLSAPTPYDGIESMDALRALMAAPIDWSWFLRVDFVQDLFHFHGMVNKELSMAEVVAYYAPVSIIDLACLVAIKLPAKKYLIGEPWETIREKIWLREEDGGSGRQFKKSHAVAYAMVVSIDAKRKAMEVFE